MLKLIFKIMEKFNYYSINGSCTLESGEIYFKDLFSSGDYSKILKGLNKYKGLYTLNKGTSKELIRIFYLYLGIKTPTEFIKELPNIGFQTRKLIKDTKENLLTIIDSPDFLPTFLYLLLGFSISQKNIISSNGKNSIKNFSSVIMSLLNEDKKIITETFFCAHRENKEISKNTLVSHVNEEAFTRVKNLLHGICSNIPTKNDYELNFYGSKGNLEGSLNIFPNILFNYFLKGELYKVSELLDSQFYHINSLVNSENEKFSSTEFIDNLVKNNISNINDKELELIKKEIYPHFKRFEKEIEKFKKLDNLKELIKINLNKAEKNGKKELVEKLIEKILNFDILEKSKEEFLFYSIWGRLIKNSGNIALGFDRDHDKYQTLSFNNGYGSHISPILYSRRTGKKSGNNINNLSFRQFWHFYD